MASNGREVPSPSLSPVVLTKMAEAEEECALNPSGRWKENFYSDEKNISICGVSLIKHSSYRFPSKEDLNGTLPKK